MGYIAIKTTLGNRFGNRRIVDLLRMVDLVTTRIAPGVVVTKVLVIALNRSDDVSLHNLHVVDVIKQLEMVACNLLAQFDPPSRQVAHVVGMVDSAIEELHIQDHLLLFCHRNDLAKRLGTVLHPGLAIDTPSVARKTDDIPKSRTRSCLDRFIDDPKGLVPILWIA